MARIALVSTAAEPATRVCGTFVLDEVVRDGSLATVYLAHAEDEVDPRFVARVIHPDLVVDGSHEVALTKAFSALQDLKVTGVPRVVAFEVSRGRPVLVTARVDGETLHDRLLTDRAMRPEEVSRMVHSLAATLDALHERTPPIVHRAVQAENVVIDARGRAWLEETGLAWALAEAGMVPEDVHLGLRPRTDVVMLATLAFRCLTGDAPDGAVARSARAEGKRPLPQAAEAVLLRGWNAEPALQYATAGAFARDLTRTLVTETTDDVDRAFDLLLTERDSATPIQPYPMERVPIESGRVLRARSSTPPPGSVRPLPSPPTVHEGMSSDSGDRPTWQPDAPEALPPRDSAHTRPTRPEFFAAPSVVLLETPRPAAPAPSPAPDAAILHAIRRGAAIISVSLIASGLVVSASVYWAATNIHTRLAGAESATIYHHVAVRDVPAAPLVPTSVVTVVAPPPTPPAAVTHNEPPPAPETVRLPPRPPDDSLGQARNSLGGPLGECVVGSGARTVHFRAVFTGATGMVDRVELPVQFAEPPTGPCLDRAIRAVHLPRFASETYAVRWTVHLPHP